MTGHDDLSADSALREVDRARSAVRKASRRGARFFLGMWLAVTAYWLLTFFGPEAVQSYAVAVPLVVVVAGFWYISRQRVYDRLLSRLAYTVTWAFLGTTVLASAYNMFLSPSWAVADVLVALVAGAPLLYGALRVFRSTGER
ncbi:hypothetical protein ACFWYW_42125 [Nonomuraea sp. NPDC059023]|uniref:hypothetical protein n=1 Tax=unclassified Nonomuraea TaxID=2593643 RepID=UPI0036807952